MDTLDRQQAASMAGLVSAQAALLAAFHIVRVLVNRGLISASDVEEMAEGVSGAFTHGGDEMLSATFDASYGPEIARMREVARDRFKGA